MTAASRLTVAAFLLPFATTACGASDPAPSAMGTEGAHEHGVARVDVAIEGNEGVITFASPAMGIYGFEHDAVTPEDRAQRDEALRRLEARFSEMFVFDSSLGCEVAQDSVDTDADPQGHDHAGEDDGAEHDHAGEEEHAGEQESTHEGGEDDHGHTEVAVEFTVTCSQPLAGSRLTFAVGDLFPGVEQLDVQVLGDRVTGGRYRSTGAGVEL